MIAPVISPTFAYTNTMPQFPTDKDKQYADPFLRSDFSLWSAAHEYRLAEMIGEVRQSWKREVSRRFVGLTEGRKAVFVREHMFQSDVDYLAQLKAER